MTETRALAADLLVASDTVVRLAADDVDSIRQRGIRSTRKRARLCAHNSHSDALHEMIICLARGTYVRPHRHPGKSESFHMIDGELDVVLFEPDGAIREVLHLAPYHSGDLFFYRLNEPCFHTVIPRSPTVLFHETTNGPFDPTDTEFAEWAPSESEGAEGYLEDLRRRIHA
jgi:cupin fold WbuC family metalloprotein